MRHGLRLDWKKEATLLAWTLRRSAPPSKVRIFLNLPAAPASRPCVETGESVRVGQTIARPGGPHSVAVHASISGVVSAIQKFLHPYGGEAEAIEIQSDSKDEKMPGLGEERKNWESLEPEELKKIFQECGLVQMRESMVPLHVKAGRGKKSKTLILNGCESEPYVTSAHALMMSHPVEILKGAEIFRKALSAERVHFVIEDNKLEVAELLQSKVYFLKWKHFDTSILPALYPQDNEKVLGRRFSAGGRQAGGEAPEILDVTSAFAVWEAVARQKPLYERPLTVGGECVIEPKNFWARNGTPLEALFKNAKGLLRQPEKVILGGPMRGHLQKLLDIPILKGTTALLALPREITGTGEEEPCIRCGRCVEACPVEISPVMITLAAERNLFELAKEYGAGECTECGNCGFVCPSRRPMLELIRRAAS